MMIVSLSTLQVMFHVSHVVRLTFSCVRISLSHHLKLCVRCLLLTLPVNLSDQVKSTWDW